MALTHHASIIRGVQDNNQSDRERVAIGSVTGVDLTLNIAGPGARSFAFVADWHIRIVLALAWYIVGAFLLNGTLKLVGEEDASRTSFLVLVVAPAAIIYLLYHPILEIAMGGTTPGKRMAGVRIVTEDGHRPGVFALLLRNILRLVDSLPSVYLVGLICTMFTQRSVRIGDIAAGTMLVYETHQYEGLSDALDAYNDKATLKQQDLARELLARWDDLVPEKRGPMGAKLLKQLEPEMPAERMHEDQIRARLAEFMK